MVELTFMLAVAVKLSEQEAAANHLSAMAVSAAVASQVLRKSGPAAVAEAGAEPAICDLQCNWLKSSGSLQ